MCFDLSRNPAFSRFQLSFIHTFKYHTKGSLPQFGAPAHIFELFFKFKFDLGFWSIAILVFTWVAVFPKDITWWCLKQILIAIVSWNIRINFTITLACNFRQSIFTWTQAQILFIKGCWLLHPVGGLSCLILTETHPLDVRKPKSFGVLSFRRWLLLL